MMSVYGCPTKKVLKGFVGSPGVNVLMETSFFGPEFKANGTNVVVGPAPTKRVWFATVTCKDGLIVKVA